MTHPTRAPEAAPSAELDSLLPTEYPELWREMAQALWDRLAAHPNVAGQDARTRARLCMDLTEAVADAIGGDTVYIPVGHLLRTDARARALIADCAAGTPVAEAARAHGYTPARGRQIVREWARADFTARQGALPLG